MKGVADLYSFNRGLISRLGLARVDIKRTALSSAIQTNWMPRVLGSMMLRPGLRFIIGTRSNLATRGLPFVFAADDTAIVELTDNFARFLVDDQLVTRPAVTAAFTNGTFDTNLTGWTDADEGLAISDWLSGHMAFLGSGADSAIRYQLVTLVESGVVHGLRVVVATGQATLRIGSSINGTQFLADTVLGAGVHSITFTPTANFYVQFSSRTTYYTQIDSVSFDPSGVLSLPSPWAAAKLPEIRFDQSGDVLFVAAGMQQYRIERRSGGSWSIVKYRPVDGPFLLDNTGPITLAAAGLTGNVAVTASKAVFTSSNVGSLFRMRSVGQTVTLPISAQNTFTTDIRVAGVGETRRFAIVITGTFVATVTLQYSTDQTTWSDHTNYTIPTSTTLLDGLDNQIIYYRLGIKTGNYTSGTATCTLNYSSGSITGVVRVTNFVSETSATCEVVVTLGSTAATSDWSEGAWSDRRGWPSAVALHDGRLWWSGKDRFWGSVTDQFETFDDEFEGDAGPISRSIGSGPVDSVRWLVSLNRLLAGTDGSIIECKSSSLDEPLTPTNFTPKAAATRGSASVDVAKIDMTAVFVQRGGSRVMEVDNSIGPQGGVLSVVSDLTTLVPEVGDPGVVRVAVQREPDTRLHCVLSDGTVAVMIWDPIENVRCWVKIETDGAVEDVVVLPGTEEDYVYYVVKRVIGGADVRYWEKWAMESEARGAAVTKVADSFVYAASASNTITGLAHLEGESVVAWGNGLDLGTFTVSGGSITLHASTTYTNRCAGLTYQAKYKSTKLAYSIEGRTGLTLKKNIDQLGLLLLDTHPQGLEFGPSFEKLDPLPETVRYGDVNLDAVWDEYDTEAVMFPGEWDTDARLCLVANAPRPCTVLAAIIELTTNTR